jgi:hypothetical protein
MRVLSEQPFMSMIEDTARSWDGSNPIRPLG